MATSASDTLKVVTPQTQGGYVPHSAETEQALLGLLMLDNKRLDALEGSLTAEHFYSPFHGAIFSTIENLINKNFEASPITVRENIRNAANYKGDADLLDILKDIMENSSLANSVHDLANIIKRHYLHRKLMEIGADLTHNLQNLAQNNAQEKIDTLINQTESELFSLSEDGSKATSTTLHNPLKAVIEQAELARATKGQITGVSSGLKDVDRILGGFQRSDLIILAARPSMGKTAFSLNVALNAAKKAALAQPGGAAVAVFSMEMSAEQLALRLLTSESRIESTKLATGDLNDEDFDHLVTASNTLGELKVIIDDTPQLHINALRSRARQMKRQHGIGMVVVDYLQLMRGTADNRVQEISEISQGLKAIARELDVPVIALSQLSRAVENRDNKRPQLSDLRESGSIEQDADIVMFLYREEYYIEKQMGTDETDAKFVEMKERLEKVKGTTELLVSKNRKGPTGKAVMVFDGPTTTFHDYVGDNSHYGGMEE